MTESPAPASTPRPESPTATSTVQSPDAIPHYRLGLSSAPSAPEATPLQWSPAISSGGELDHSLTQILVLLVLLTLTLQCGSRLLAVITLCGVIVVAAHLIRGLLGQVIDLRLPGPRKSSPRPRKVGELQLKLLQEDRGKLLSEIDRLDETVTAVLNDRDRWKREYDILAHTSAEQLAIAKRNLANVMQELTDSRRRNADLTERLRTLRAPAPPASSLQPPASPGGDVLPCEDEPAAVHG